MIGNYIKLALRHMIRQRSYVVINVIGLAIGLACSIIISLFVIHELSYDDFNEKKDRIWRLYLDGKLGETELKGAWTCSPAAPAFKRDFPEVVDAVRINTWGETVIKYKDRSFIEDGFMEADSTFFNIFSIPMIQGDPQTALAAPHTVVLTRKAAGRIFGSSDPVGEMIKVGTDSILYTITGVMEDVPDNSHFKFNMLGSFVTNQRANSDIWFSNSFYTYLLLEEGASVEQLNAKIPEWLKQYLEPQGEKMLGITWEEFIQGGNRYGFYLQPLEDIHLNTEIEHGLEPSNDRRYIIIFSLVAVLILIIASINYMNLATARSAKRSREVGLRKVVGSLKRQIIWQFLFESVVITLVSLVFAILIVELCLPYFNNLINSQLSLAYITHWYVIPGLIGLGLFISVIAGSYPAFFLASFRPVAVLRGPLKSGSGGKILRSILVVVQMTVSVIIILATMIVYKQVNYMLNKDLGFNKGNLMVISRAGALGEKQQTFIDEVKKLSGVEQVSHSTAVPGHPNNHNGYWMEGQSSEKSYLMQTNWSDYDYPETYQLTMADGRFFSKNFASDSGACIINESAVRQFGLEDPLKVRFMQPGDEPQQWIYLQVIGVVKDFHYQSLHDRIFPHIFILYPNRWNWGYISLRLNPGNIQNTIIQAEKLWQQFSDNDPMVYFFMDEDFERLYAEEKRTGILAFLFSVLAILIACLGLFGLTSFTAEQRTKEIGIRKANGAKGIHILWLLGREVAVLVCAATLIAWPVTYFVMKAWLQNFYFRINLSPFEFIISLLITLAIALLTISYRALRAANINPADALRHE